jgi:competence protein ComEC
MQIIRDIKSIPVFRLLSAIIIGILAVKWVEIPFQLAFACAFVAFIFLIAGLLFRLGLKPGIAWLNGIFVYMIFISTGILSMKGFQSGIHVIPDSSKEIWLGEMITEPVLKNKLARFEISLFHDSTSRNRSKSQVLMQVGSGFILPHAGQIIVLKTRPERIPGPMNPGEFDYAEYLRSNGILYKCFVKESDWKILPSPGKITIGLLALRVKSSLWEKIENLESGNKNLGVLYAISLGSKDLLTPEIRESYAVTGAMHVLVVSGQHIALIWMVLGYIFVWLKDIKGGLYIQFFLISGLIWFYSFMTGITASVVRASGMFTLVSLGRIIQKESSIYNSLSVSAFFGLLLFPQWLTDAGFQLSYIAVLSIVFFQPKIASLWEPRRWIVQQIWEITSVSIAAQIGTLPLTLFYFNRFPPWFIISNIVVIPIVTLIMILFIIMLLFMMIPFLFSLFLKIILLLIGVMNMALADIERLPTPGMDMIYLTGFQMFLFSLLILAITFFISYRKNYLIILGLISLLLIISSGSFRKFKVRFKNEMILFSVPGKMMLGLFENEKGLFLHNAADSVNIESIFNYRCRPFVVQNRIRVFEIAGLDDSSKYGPGFRKIPGDQNYFYRYKGLSILILNDPAFFKGFHSEKMLDSDILIVNNRIPFRRKDQQVLFRSRQLVISSACSKNLKFNRNDNIIILSDSLFDIRKDGYFRFAEFGK